MTPPSIAIAIARLRQALVGLIFGMLGASAGLAQTPSGSWRGPMPDVPPALRSGARIAANFDVVLRPDRGDPEWWAGAPSVVRGPDGTFWLAARMRDAVSPRGFRGYEIRVLKSADGLRFEKAASIRREDVPVPGFERPALLIDPSTGRFKLYACTPWQNGPWSIIKFDDAASPEAFDPKSARVVIAPKARTYERDVPPVEYKDPFIIHAGGRFHAYVIGVMRQTERIYHFSSADGEAWEPVGSPYDSVMELSGWHNFYVRPSCLLPLGLGWLFVYEGSNVNWRDPVYNITTGLGVTFDLDTVRDVTPEGPWLASTTPADGFATFRYSHWLWVGREIWIYAEETAPDLTHEIRLHRITPDGP